MDLGYDGQLYILAFDHRGSFQKKYFGIQGDPTPEDVERITDAKRLVFEGLELALERGADPSVTGALVDEQFGGDVPRRANERGVRLAMPVEKSGVDVFDFEYGDDFGARIEAFDTDFSKVLVRLNPDGDADENGTQLERLKRLSDWLREHERKFLFELLVPGTPEHLESVGGDTDRYDAELRPELMRRAMAQIQDAGIEVDIWKIEGVDERADCEMLAEQARVGGRDTVKCVLLGRGADDDKVDHWLTQAAPVEGFVGFAIGRSIWGGPLAGFLDGSLDRGAAASQVADNYLRFVRVYQEAQEELSVR
jgi:myo-inositol catabolism protein IolC